jgi:hypothetical protein
VPQDRVPTRFSRELNAEYIRQKEESERKKKAEIAKAKADKLKAELNNLESDSFELGTEA